jgi:hypothetical protein
LSHRQVIFAARLTDQNEVHMRLQILMVAVALGVGSSGLAQTTSSSSSPQQLPLPAAPHSPKSLAECDAYQKRLDDQMAQISQQHSACLESFKEDRQGDNNLICSRSECQSLHTLLYGPHKTAGEQQVTSCQAAVQRYQARSAAQQQGIQTLGNAIGDLLTSSPSTPIDSQNDLANYENQQNGQPVLGDDASSGIPVDDSAKRVMSSSSNSDGSPSVQSQLDSVIDDDMSNTSTSYGRGRVCRLWPQQLHSLELGCGAVGAAAIGSSTAVCCRVSHGTRIYWARLETQCHRLRS